MFLKIVKVLNLLCSLFFLSDIFKIDYFIILKYVFNDFIELVCILFKLFNELIIKNKLKGFGVIFGYVLDCLVELELFEVEVEEVILCVI